MTSFTTRHSPHRLPTIHRRILRIRRLRRRTRLRPTIRRHSPKSRRPTRHADRKVWIGRTKAQEGCLAAEKTKKGKTKQKSGWSESRSANYQAVRKKQAADRSTR